VDEGDDVPSSSADCVELLDDPNRGRLELSVRTMLLHPVAFLKASGPFLTSHHPSCPQFDDHRVSIRRRQWCIGCTFNTLSFFIAMLVFLFLWFFVPTLLVLFYLFWGGVGGVIIYAVLSASGITDISTSVKIASKFVLGPSFAAISWSILLANGLFSPGLELKILLIVILYLFVLTFLNAKRMYEIVRECEDCEYSMRWSQCPGMRGLVCRLVEGGFVRAAPIQHDNS
jgi:hypothetical protein